jgi:hypothetical protein
LNPGPPEYIQFLIDDVIENVTELNMQAPVIGDLAISGLLYADDLAVAAFMVNGLQKAIDQIVKSGA